MCVFFSFLQELIRKTKDSVVKEKEDEDARLKSQAKRLDYITRALRIEEMPVLRKKYEAQVNHSPRVGVCLRRGVWREDKHVDAVNFNGIVLRL